MTRSGSMSTWLNQIASMSLPAWRSMLRAIAAYATYGRNGEDTALSPALSGFENENYGVQLNWQTTPGERSAKADVARTYDFWEAGMKHFVSVQVDTVARFRGMEPWTINYVNPADAPRNAK